MFVNRDDLFQGRSRLADTLGLIYETVTDAQLWPAALEAVADSLRAQGGGLIFRDEFTPRGTVSVEHGLERSIVESYHAYYGALDVWFAASQSSLPGTATLSSDLLSQHALVKTEFYDGFLRPAHIEYQCGILLEREGSRFSALTLTRGGDQQEFDRDDLERLHAFTPHLRRVLRLNALVSKAERKVSGLMQTLEALDRVVFGLGEDGAVVFSSACGEAFLAAERGLACTGGRLHLKGIRQDIELQAMIAAVTSRLAGLSASTQTAHFVQDDLSSLRIIILPHRGGAGGHGGTPLGALLFLDDSANQPASRSQLLRALYHLTPTEVRIVQMLVAGQDLNTIARTLATNGNNVRFHLKNVFRKMNVGKQSDVIRAVLSLPADVAPDAER